MYLSTEQYSWPVGLAEVTESDHSVHLQLCLHESRDRIVLNQQHQN